VLTFKCLWKYAGEHKQNNLFEYPNDNSVNHQLLM